MHVFEMVVLLVLIGSITTIVSKFMERKGGKDASEWLGMGDDDMGLGLGKSVSLERLEQLEERVAVLERIVTDKKYDLKEEFERL